MNTLRASFGSARTSWAARHTSSLTGRTADARAALNLAWKVSDNFRREAEALSAQTITDAQVGQVLTSLWPDDPAATARTRERSSRRRAQVRRIYQSDPRVAGWHGTAYGLVQAISTWELWEAPRRGDRGEQVLTGLFSGSRTRAVDAAERITALA